MYKRFRDGLVSPKSIVDYIKDKMYKPLLQLLLYALLMTIPVIINNLTYSGLEYNTQVSIASNFNGSTIPFVIMDGTLVNVNGDEDYAYTGSITKYLLVRISESETNDNISAYVIELGQTSFKIKFSYLTMFEGKYEDYEELKNIDLRALGNQNSTEWDNVFSVVNSIVKSFYKNTIVFASVVSVIRYYIYLLLFALLIALSFLIRFNKLIKFSAMFKMGAYYTAPFVVGIIITNLTGSNLFYIIGVILSVAYPFIGSSTIIQRLLNSDRK